MRQITWAVSKIHYNSYKVEISEATNVDSLLALTFEFIRENYDYLNYISRNIGEILVLRMLIPFPPKEMQISGAFLSLIIDLSLRLDFGGE